jgi:nitrate reductase NapAB chaperone NapD
MEPFQKPTGVHMKITFEDKSFVEVKKSDNPGKIVLTISAKDHTDPLKKITNAVEITTEEFKKLISDV